MDDEQQQAFDDFEQAARKLLSTVTGATYNAVESWALVMRATANDGDGDRVFGGLFMPPEQDQFTTAGLRWLFDEGFRGRYQSEP